MRLQHRTEVDADPEEVWALLQDTQAVVRCLPGAELTDELGADRYRGLLRVAIGPLTMNYQGEVSVLERDARARRIVMVADGRDRRGSGSVQARVHLHVEPSDRGSRLDVVSDVELTGRIASLGRGVKDISNRMFTQFTDTLTDSVARRTGTTATGPAAAEPAAAEPAADGPRAPGPAATGPIQRRTPVDAGEIRLLALVWSVTRERLADALDRLSARVRPH